MMKQMKQQTQMLGRWRQQSLNRQAISQSAAG